MNARQRVDLIVLVTGAGSLILSAAVWGSIFYIVARMAGLT